MKHFQKIHELRNHLQSLNQSIGFVPTMGALHEGHLSLIKKAKEQTQVVVCSIFVNPTQFNDLNDYEKYPITLEDDLNKLENIKCDVVFYPTITEMYPTGLTSLTNYPLGNLETILEGKFRPGHFQGVCNIVDRLLQAVKPNKLFMGEKDFQQIAVVRKLLELTKSSVELIACPTIRSAEGLALSSRNQKLSEAQKKQAISIYKGFELKDHTEFQQYLLDNGFNSVDYIFCADPFTLEEKKMGEKPYIILVAAFIGGIRLIDNKLFL